MDFLNELNPAQKEAADHKEGPLLVVAGAGSGKTRVLTYRIAALLQKGVPSHQILAVTFTNKAAKEMANRVEGMLNGMSAPLIGTFHSIGVRILRRDIGVIGRDSSFTIFDSADILALAKRLLKEKNINAQTLAPRTLLAAISSYKNAMKMPPQVYAMANTFRDTMVAELYERYQKELLENNALDFDDLILLPVEVFKTSPDTLAKYQSFWRYVMIDEYQDTNYLQYLFARMISEPHRNICAIGDSDQSIYSFRGADLSNILNFQKEYSDAKVVKLEQNYRSTKNILDGADAVIAQNSDRIPKKMFTDEGEGECISIESCDDERMEADMIFNTIDTAVREGSQYSDMAILYRTNAQSRALEESALRHAIPYTMVGGLKFYSRAEVKDILAYLRFILNPEENISFERIVNVPARKIGKTSILKLATFAQERGMKPGTVLSHLSHAQGIPTAALNSLQAFYLIIENLRKQREKMPLSDFIDTVIKKVGYEDYLLSEGEEGAVRLENIRELASVARKYDESENALPLFLEEVALISDLDNVEVDNNRVTMMTIHAAKGLEFPQVFVAGCEENIFPSSRSLHAAEDLEEERRLMYVAMTRARKKLTLSYAKNRLLYGDFMTNPASRFLSEIPETICDGTHFQATFNTSFSFSSTSSPSYSSVEELVHENDYNIGEIVEHPKFGLGKIVAIEGDILSIVFERDGTKRLAASIAPLEKKDPDFL